MAIAADYYGMPIFAYMEHLRRVRERYGEEASTFDLEHAVALRDGKLQAKIEAIEAQRRNR